MNNRQKFALIAAIFLTAYFAPFGNPHIQGAVMESLYMLQDYVRLHVLTCLVPAFFIAGAISSFISQGSVIKYLGGEANKAVSYLVASVSGTVLAVCSCTVLPLFAGIYKKGAGIGPAFAFLYSGPAINILAIILTARILGPKLGIARAVGAIFFSIIIGLIMTMMFKNDDKVRMSSDTSAAYQEDEVRTPLQNILYFAVMILILIFAAWGKPEQEVGFFSDVYNIKWYITAALLVILYIIVLRWFKREEVNHWFDSTWIFALQIMPLLFMGVMAAGLMMGRPGTDAGLIPSRYVSYLVGGNSITANLIASVVGAFMYFATLTEVPILQGLIGSGMGHGPALSLLLSGPALSLPSMLVLNSIVGFKKTAAYITLVVVMSTIAGYIFGMM